MQEVWERQKDEKETSREFEKFIFYRDMPLNGQMRSVRATAEHFGINKTTLLTVAAQRRWTERATAYDDYIRDKQRKENELELIKMTKMQAEVGRLAISKAKEALEKINTDKMTASDIARLMDVGVKIERLARGEETENLQVKNGDCGKINVIFSNEPMNDLQQF